MQLYMKSYSRIILTSILMMIVALTNISGCSSSGSNEINCFIPNFSDGIQGEISPTFLPLKRFDSINDNSFIRLFIDEFQCLLEFFPDKTTNNVPYTINGNLNEENTVCVFHSGTLDYTGVIFITPFENSTGILTLQNNEILKLENVMIGDVSVSGIDATCADNSFIPPQFPPTVECIELNFSENSFEEDFNNCPAEGLSMICNTLFCNFIDGDDDLVLFSSIPRENCEVIDCMTMTCPLESTEFLEENIIIGQATITFEAFFDNPEFLFGGPASIDGQDGFSAQCGIPIP